MPGILEGIDSPEHVRKLSLSELEQLAAEIRERLITVLSNNGGHLVSNTGVVELTIALHYVFRTPDDMLLFDVSHQAYVHKLLTGRRERFYTIRTPGGLNGFMLRSKVRTIATAQVMLARLSQRRSAWPSPAIRPAAMNAYGGCGATRRSHAGLRTKP